MILCLLLSAFHNCCVTDSIFSQLLQHIIWLIKSPFRQMNLSEWPVQHYCGTIKLLLIPTIGPDLPYGIPDADLIEDPAGGVILVGGNSPFPPP